MFDMFDRFRYVFDMFGDCLIRFKYVFDIVCYVLIILIASRSPPAQFYVDSIILGSIIFDPFEG